MGDVRVKRVGAEIVRAMLGTSSYTFSLTNAGAETGDATGWTAVGSTTVSASSARANTGTYSFQLSGSGSTLNRAYQTISIPSGNYSAVDSWSMVLSLSGQIMRDLGAYRKYGSSVTSSANITINSVVGLVAGMTCINSKNNYHQGHTIFSIAGNVVTLSATTSNGYSDDYFEFAWSFTGNTTSGQNKITNISSTANLSVGMSVFEATGSDLGGGSTPLHTCTIVSVDSSTQVTLSVNVSSTLTARTFYFVSADSGCLAVQFLDGGGAVLDGHYWRTDNIFHSMDYGLNVSSSMPSSSNHGYMKDWQLTAGAFPIPGGTRSLKIYMETYTPVTSRTPTVWIDNIVATMAPPVRPFSTYESSLIGPGQDYRQNTAQMGTIPVQNWDMSSGYARYMMNTASDDSLKFNWLLNSAAGSVGYTTGLDSAAPIVFLVNQYDCLLGVTNGNFDVSQRVHVAQYFTTKVIDSGRAWIEAGVYIGTASTDIPDVEYRFFDGSGAEITPSYRVYNNFMYSPSNNKQLLQSDLINLPTLTRSVQIHLRGIYNSASTTQITYQRIVWFARIGHNFSLLGYRRNSNATTLPSSNSGNFSYNTITFGGPVTINAVTVNAAIGSSSFAGRLYIFTADANGNPTLGAPLAMSPIVYNYGAGACATTRPLRFCFSVPVTLAAGTYCIGVGCDSSSSISYNGYGNAPPTVTATCSINSTATITVPAATGSTLHGKMWITGTGIANGSAISSITNATTIVSTVSATATNASASVTFSRRLTITGTTTNGSPIITALPYITGITKGMPVSGPGVPINSFVVSSTALTVTINQNATASATVSINFDASSVDSTDTGFTFVKAAYTTISSPYWNIKQEQPFNTTTLNVGGVFDTSKVTAGKSPIPMTLITQSTPDTYYNPWTVIAVTTTRKRRLFIVS